MIEVKVGLIGLGFMGTTHWKIYQQLPDVRVTALADIDPVKRTGDIRGVTGNIGENNLSKPLDLTNVELYDNALELIEKADVDYVDICVPTPDHAQFILAALNAGKHVFCEKPLCRTREEMRTIRQALAQSDRFFNVGMCIRTWPEYVHARNFLASGAAGAVKVAQFRRLSPSVAGNSWQDWFMHEACSGGAILDLHLHDTDIICHLFGRPEKVRSAGIRGVVSDHGIDHVISRYLYPDGKLVIAEGGWCADPKVPFEMSFQLICERATLKLDGSGYHIYRQDGEIESPQPGNCDLPTGWHQELNYFVQCIRNRISPTRYQTPQSIFDAFAVLQAEIESVNSGKTVVVEYV